MVIKGEVAVGLRSRFGRMSLGHMLYGFQATLPVLYLFIYFFHAAFVNVYILLSLPVVSGFKDIKYSRNCHQSGGTIDRNVRISHLPAPNLAWRDMT